MDGPGLRALREAHGLTTREVAALAGISRRSLQQIEQGTRRATPGLVAWLTRVYSRRASAKSCDSPGTG
jgi:transcriptional regulator with XRE-family HTH domain